MRRCLSRQLKFLEAVKHAPDVWLWRIFGNGEQASDLSRLSQVQIKCARQEHCNYDGRNDDRRHEPFAPIKPMRVGEPARASGVHIAVIIRKVHFSH